VKALGKNQSDKFLVEIRLSPVVYQVELRNLPFTLSSGVTLLPYLLDIHSE
jgi:hypothetical protein